MYKTSKGFSLTEVLVVVALISLIAAFALPEYGEMIRKNRERAVIADLRSIQSASLIYRATNGGFWDTNDVWINNNLGTIENTFGITLNDPSGLIEYSYIYELGNGSDTHAVRADWIENSNRSTIEIRETGDRVVEGPCCNINVGDPCATLPANLPDCS